ncbi:MAG TPA: flagellin, partial [Gammaproteobacteria bacterium]|nr:flagellin [Gammaproteobacteria bacterium]
MLSINSNISSLIAQNNLRQSTNSLRTSYERLSSGKRINSAKDDAAGLAISDRLTAQVRGLNQASRNANDGISLGQTGEGAMQEMSNMLQRMRELSVQSANDTNSDSDRQSLNQEFKNLSNELDRIAKTTSFNGQNILDGSAGNMTFQVGANVGETISVNLNNSMETNSIGRLFTSKLDINNSTSMTGVTSASSLASGLAGLESGDLTLNGVSVGAAQNNGPGESALSAVSIADAINKKSQESGVDAQITSQASVTMSVTGTTDTVMGAATTTGGGMVINGVTVTNLASSDSMTANAFVNAINSVEQQTGVTAKFNDANTKITMEA